MLPVSSLPIQAKARDWCGQFNRAYPLVDNFVTPALASGIDPDALLRPMLIAAFSLRAGGIVSIRMATSWRANRSSIW